MVCTYTTQTCTHTNAHTHTHTHTHTFPCIYIYIHVDVHIHTQTHTCIQTHTYMHMYLHIRYRSNATSHPQVSNSWDEHCYTRVNCNDSQVILWLLACSILCMYLVLVWYTHKLHMRSVYTRECPKHTSDHTRYIYIKI